MWDKLDIRNAYYMTTSRCPCYCGGEGVIMLVVCPECSSVLGMCDEVEELIADPKHPEFDPENSRCHPDDLCPVCGVAAYGSFRHATPSEIEAAGIPATDYKKWRT
jgi:hypothetical protein